MEKYVRDSYAEQVQILSQSSLNGYKRLFGSQLSSGSTWLPGWWPGATPTGT